MTTENPWRKMKDAPANGEVLEGVNELGISALFILEYEPPSGETTKTWWGKIKTTTRDGGTFMYLALPHSGGYSRLSSRSNWSPKYWRYHQILPVASLAQKETAP